MQFKSENISQLLISFNLDFKWLKQILYILGQKELQNQNLKTVFKNHIDVDNNLVCIIILRLLHVMWDKANDWLYWCLWK